MRKMGLWKTMESNNEVGLSRCRRGRSGLIKCNCFFLFLPLSSIGHSMRA